MSSNIIDFAEAKKIRDDEKLFNAVFAYTVERLLEEGYDNKDVNDMGIDTVLLAMEHFIKEAAAEKV